MIWSELILKWVYNIHLKGYIDACKCCRTGDVKDIHQQTKLVPVVIG